MTLMFDSRVILLGEILSQSVLGIKELHLFVDVYPFVLSSFLVKFLFFFLSVYAQVIGTKS